MCFGVLAAAVVAGILGNRDISDVSDRRHHCHHDHDRRDHDRGSGVESSMNIFNGCEQHCGCDHRHDHEHCCERRR